MRIIFTALLVALLSTMAEAQQCKILSDASFPGDGEIVRLARA